MQETSAEMLKCTRALHTVAARKGPLSRSGVPLQSRKGLVTATRKDPQGCQDRLEKKYLEIVREHCRIRSVARKDPLDDRSRKRALQAVRSAARIGPSKGPGVPQR